MSFPLQVALLAGIVVGVCALLIIAQAVVRRGVAVRRPREDGDLQMHQQSTRVGGVTR